MGVARAPTPIGFDGRALTTSEPLSDENLTIVFLRGPDTLSEEWSTVEEASRSGEARIREIEGGGSVPELRVKNDGKKSLYLRAGEPLKGGRQDRVLSCDSVVPAAADEKVPVYCIERQRWSGGGDFGDGGAVSFIAPTRALKFIIQHKPRSQQSEVWDEVRRMKQKAVDALKLDTSRTSSLNEELGGVSAHRRFSGLAPAALSHPIPDDAVGAVSAVNGNVTHFELYASHALFVRQHPKLARSAVLEALLESGGLRHDVDRAALRAWVVSAIAALDPEKARAAYEGGLPRFESIDAAGMRSVFGYRHAGHRLRVQGVAYAAAEKGRPRRDD